MVTLYVSGAMFRIARPARSGKPPCASASNARDYILMRTHYKKIIVEMDFSVGVTGQTGNAREFVVPYGTPRMHSNEDGLEETKHVADQ
jgi:hypothetical protein